jgi:hypothetical protein
VAHLLHDDAASVAGQRAQRQVVGQRARRHEDRPLLAEQGGPVLLEPLDFAAEQVVVLGNLGLPAQFVEQRGIGARRDGNAVAAKPHAAVAVRWQSRGHAGKRGQQGGSGGRADRSDEAAPCD